MATRRLVDGCCLGAAMAGLALSVGFGRCEQGRAGTMALSTLTPIMQPPGPRAPDRMPCQGGAPFASAYAVR